MSYTLDHGRPLCRACGSNIMGWRTYFLASLFPQFSFTAMRDMDGRKPVGAGYCRVVGELTAAAAEGDALKQRGDTF